MSDQARQDGDQTQPGGDQARQDGDRAETRRRVSVQEAARLLGTTVEGIRSRIKRGTLESERVEGAVYVLLTPDQAQPDGDQAETGRSPGDRPGSVGELDAVALLVEELKDRVRSLETQLLEERTANRENRRLLAALVQRVTELEAPPEARGWPETASDEAEGMGAPPGKERPSLWRRLFGGM
jgi:hypothetical protein